MKVPFLCTSQRLRAQEAPIYGPFGDSGFAEDSILNAGVRHNMHEIYQEKTDYSG